MSEHRNIPLYKVHMPDDLLSSLEEVLHSGKIAHGPNVLKFEKQLQEYIENPYITSTRDISTSIQLALFMAGVRPDDEVVATPMACLATNMPVLNLFAKIKWIDLDPLTGNISLSDLKNNISEKTKAILLYHWAGNPIEIEQVNQIAVKYNIPVIDDAGEAFGAEINGKKLGNQLADYTVFSFHAIRHITTGDGAAIAFKSKDEYEKGIWLKRYGIHQPSFRDALGEINPKSDILVPGYNSYLNQLEATIGIHQMYDIAEIVRIHQKNGLYYDSILQDVPGITVLKRPQNSKSAYWVYTFLAENRDALLHVLRNHGIYASKVHLRNDIYSCFGPITRQLPGVDAFDQKYISIPSGWWVTKDDREFINNIIRKGW